MKEGLNLQCPYKVFKETNSSIYSFTTKNGIEYNIVFSELNIFNSTTTGEKIEKVYDLIIERVTKTSEPFDPNTGKTIMKIVEKFFKDKDNSLFYICEHKDKKQKKRSNTFRKWSNQIAEQKYINHLQRDFKASYISEEHLQYSGLIFHSDNTSSNFLVVAYNELINDWDERIA